VVRIAARRDADVLVISVQDDGPGIESGDAPAGHGIANTRERLRALHGEQSSLAVTSAIGGGTTATLRVPYRELTTDATHAG
jgi:hypothetical protein